MGQSRRSSMVETIIGTVVGFFISTVINFTVVPVVLDTKVSMSDQLILVAVFTVASIVLGTGFAATSTASSEPWPSGAVLLHH